MSSDGYQHLHEVAPGLLFGSVHRFQELKDCMLSECDSWVLKFEQLLIHGSFLFGYVNPRRLVWIIMRSLLNRVSTHIGGQLSLQPEFEMGMSLLEQMGLTYIWDVLRDGSICMRFNNCENDFMAQISNIKISVCNVSDSSDDMAKLSVCERIFNDSPLILLAFGMVVLSVIAHSTATSLSTPNTPNASNQSNSENSGTSSTNPDTSSDPSPGFSSILDSGSSKRRTSFISPSFPVPDNGPTRELQVGLAPAVSTSNKCAPPHQDIQAQCPKCKRKFKCTVPKPWRLACAQIVPSVKEALKNKRGGSGITSCKTAQDENCLSEKEVRELIKDIKCNHCKGILEKKLEAIILKHKQRKPTDAEQTTTKKSK